MTTLRQHVALNMAGDSQTMNGISHQPVERKTGTDCAMPIAICGMALRLPGGLASPKEFWDFLLAKGDARGRVPSSRYNVSSYYSPTGKPGSVATEYGYFLDETVELGALDTSFFSMTRSEVERADPQQRLLLEVARECFEDAGVVNWRGKKIGCYVGSFGEDWVDMFAKDSQSYGIHRVVGAGDFALSNRLSYEMDLQGPSMTIRTACSSSLTSLNEACMALIRGDCESAVVGGVNLILSPGMTIAMTEQGVLSKDGSCKTFSADANGYARGEAITAVYIKPLESAIRDGNPIRAVIRATSYNVDGRTPGMSQPSADAQEALIRRAYQVAGIEDFGETAMVECHGTGTAIGDPIEATAIARIFGGKGKGVYIGSVKPNLGHAEGASGLVSVIKMVLALENRVIPPNIRFSSPNPNIPFESAKLTVPVEPAPWPESKRERASVNSFGIGGANAHVILDSAASFKAAPTFRQTVTRGAHLLLYSANSLKSLARMSGGYEKYLQEKADKAGDLAYTLAFRRERLPHRSFAIVKSDGTFGGSSIPTKPSGPIAPKVVMVFTGQGAQWAQMGRELLQLNSVFRDTIRELNHHLQDLGDTPGYSIEQELLKPSRQSKISTATLSQPLCTAVQIALVNTLKSLGVQPTAVIGHSSGEIAAAYAAGGMSAREAIVTAHFRGVAASEQKRLGAMAAIGMSWEETEKFLIAGSVVACDNSPSSVTISGDADAIATVLASIKDAHPNILARRLQVDKAYHSYHMVEIGDFYLESLHQHGVLGGVSTRAAFFSSVTGKMEPGSLLNAEYWRRNLESPVLFQGAVSSILQHEIGKDAIFLEIGPHSALAGPLRQILTSKSCSGPYVSTLSRGQDCQESLLTTLGKLWALHVGIEFKEVIPNGVCLPDLPRYPWNYEGSHWFESRLSKEWRQRTHAYHNLLGARAVECTDIEPVWRNVFHSSNVPWILDHKVGEDVVFPFAGYIALAGEAMRQISGINEGFGIRNLLVSLALVIPEGKPIEIVTTFRPVRLTSSLNSQWWEFTVSSLNGQTWNKHCVGEITVKSTKTIGSTKKEPGSSLPRKIAPQSWYDTMRKTGLDLGPSFQTIQDIESSIGAEDQTSVAVANLTATSVIDSEDYHIHPTVIDGTLQLLSCAATNGLARKLKNWLPTSIERLDVARCSSPLTSRVSAGITSNQSLFGEGFCTSGENIVLNARGIKLSLGGDSRSNDMLDTHAAARYTWWRDIDFMDVDSLTKHNIDQTSQLAVLEELTKLCIVSGEVHASILPPSVMANLAHYAEWVDITSSSIHATQSISRDEVGSILEQWASRLSGTPAARAVTSLHRVYTNMGSLLQGTQTLEQLLSDDLLSTDLMDFVTCFDMSKFIRTMGHSKPTLRVLEISDDKVSPSRNIVQSLTLPGGEVLCSKYTFTSQGYVSGKDQEKLFPGMEFVTLDITKDLAEQGFEASAYDLIILSTPTQPFSRCPKMDITFSNIKKLMAPYGRVILHNMRSSSLWARYVFGSRSTWFRERYTTIASTAVTGVVSVDCLGTQKSAIRSDLSAAGIDVEHFVQDSLSTTVVAKLPTETEHLKKNVLLLCPHLDGGAKYIDSVSLQLQRSGYQVKTCFLEDMIPVGTDVISLLDCDKPFFQNIDDTRFDALKGFLKRLEDAGIFWVTLNSQVGCSDPRYSPVIGFARTMRSEMLIDFATCEVENFMNPPTSLISVFQKFQRRHDVQDGYLQPDFEFSIQDRVVSIGRYYPMRLRDELVASSQDVMAILDVATPGRVNTLRWSQHVPERLGECDVEVEVHAVGLNFRDVLVAMNVVELPVRQFGLEASGVVIGKGSKVKDFEIGDRVLCLKKSAFATRICVPDFSCAKIPDAVNFKEAASLLVPYVTAIHSLMNVGSLTKGQSVLIHSACGGVGLAAVQVAQMLEAEVYTSVSSEEKVQFLMGEFGIPRTRIFYSRDESFVDGIMGETGGEGVDLILNSLSGELLHATWSCVADFGKMVEIGKRDLMGGAKLDMRPFLANRSYCCVDIDQLWRKPGVLKSLISSTTEFLTQGRIKPVRPVKAFDAHEIQEAFRYMQKGQHIGRVAVALQKIGFHVEPKRRDVSFNSSASYLLVGGLGGLGQSVSRWMIEHGACELIYLSRGAGKVTPETQAFIKELEISGCQVHLVAGDVTMADDVVRAVVAATLPLKGVMQMSMVLKDENFENMTIQDWNMASAPKIQGTWNLHNATRELDLDFFLLFSSLSGSIGQPGQANYASANTFLDAFAQYRDSLGLTASVIDIGAVEGVGVISQTRGLLSKMKSTGFKSVSEQELLDAIAVSVTASKTTTNRENRLWANRKAFVVGLGSEVPINSPANRSVWRRDRRMAVYHNMVEAAGSGAGGVRAAANAALKTFLSSARADPSMLSTVESENFLAVEIGKKLFDLLLKPYDELNTTWPLVDLGLDSLVAIELRAWWKQTFGFDISVLEMMGMGSLEALGQRAAKGLLGVAAMSTETGAGNS